MVMSSPLGTPETYFETGLSKQFAATVRREVRPAGTSIIWPAVGRSRRCTRGRADSRYA
jgi:hypothetical protein